MKKILLLLFLVSIIFVGCSSQPTNTITITEASGEETSGEITKPNEETTEYSGIETTIENESASNDEKESVTEETTTEKTKEPETTKPSTPKPTQSGIDYTAEKSAAIEYIKESVKNEFYGKNELTERMYTMWPKEVVDYAINNCKISWYDVTVDAYTSENWIWSPNGIDDVLKKDGFTKNEIEKIKALISWNDMAQWFVEDKNNGIYGIHNRKDMITYLKEEGFNDTHISYGIANAYVDWFYNAYMFYSDYWNENYVLMGYCDDYGAFILKTYACPKCGSYVSGGACVMNKTKKECVNVLKELQYTDKEIEYAMQDSDDVRFLSEENTRGWFAYYGLLEYALSNYDSVNIADCKAKLKSWGYNDSEINYALNLFKKTNPYEYEAICNVVILDGTESYSNAMFDCDVYITSTGNITFDNVTVYGNIYCYGKLTTSSSTANNVYAYKYGSMFSCNAFDGTHGIISGGLSCELLYIKDDALDYAFDSWGKR